MRGFDDYKPATAMIALQFSYAAVSLTTRAAMLKGMSPSVFVVYRQAIATLSISPIAYFSRRKSSDGRSMDLRTFYIVFAASLMGVAISQNAYFEGMYLASSSMASAMGNLVPAVTFAMTWVLGIEKVNIRSLRSVAKIVGTISCVGGAVSMALIKGPKLVNASLFGSVGEDWMLGCALLFLSSCCWAVWLILQVPASASYPDHLSLSAWMCFISTFQCAVVAVFLEPNIEAWRFSSALELGCCFFSGIVGSAISFFVQGWCVSKRGPLFCATFNPLCTVIVTVLAAVFLQEKIYTGGLLGAIGVVIGLYVLLWGKAKETHDTKEETNAKLQTSTDRKQVVDICEKDSCKIDLKEPLLSH